VVQEVVKYVDPVIVIAKAMAPAKEVLQCLWSAGTLFSKLPKAAVAGEMATLTEPQLVKGIVLSLDL
jgi:hypothetical protein